MVTTWRSLLAGCMILLCVCVGMATDVLLEVKLKDEWGRPLPGNRTEWQVAVPCLSLTAWTWNVTRDNWTHAGTAGPVYQTNVLAECAAGQVVRVKLHNCVGAPRQPYAYVRAGWRASDVKQVQVDLMVEDAPAHADTVTVPATEVTFLVRPFSMLQLA